MSVPVPRRSLGDTGLVVSALGLGTVKFGRTQGLKYPAPFELPDDRRIRMLLDEARALGINLVDTAPAYGDAEKRLGAAIAGHRGDWILATKVGEEFEAGHFRFDFTPEATMRSVARSLARLRTSWLDVVLIHSNGADEDILDRYGTLEALAELKTRGLVRAVGISHKTVHGAERAIGRGADVIMATVNLEERGELDVIQRAAAGGVGVLVKKALGSGRLPPAGTGGPAETATDSLAFAVTRPGVSSVVVGTVDPAHLRADARVVRDAIAAGRG